MSSRDRHAVGLAVPPEEASRRLARAAESWGAELAGRGDDRRLRLPVVAGIRRGVLEGPVSVHPADGGSRVELVVDSESWRVQPAPVVILLLGAAGALVTLLWPLVPRLVGLVPAGLLLAFCSWFLVVARLQTSGPEDFLGTLEDAA